MLIRRPGAARLRPRHVVAALAGLSALGPRVARADDQTALCEAAYEQTQVLRAAGKLAAARREALSCAVDACPSVVRKDCTTWVGEIDQSLPTIAIHVTNADGCDETSARVSIDGAVIAEANAGRAFPVDPGEHELHVELPSGSTQSRHLVVAQGEKSRAIPVTFAPAGTVCGAPHAPSPPPGLPPGARPTTPSSPPPSSRPPAVESRPWTAPTIAFGAIGLASAAASITLGSVGLARRSSICDATGCDPDKTGGVRALFIGSDVCTGVAVASLTTALILHLTRPTVRTAAALETPRFGVSPHGAFVAIGGSL